VHGIELDLRDREIGPPIRPPKHRRTFRVVIRTCLMLVSTSVENRTLSSAENRTLGTGGDERQVVCFSFDLGVLLGGDEAEAEAPLFKERQSSV
jgi:hypothetical protein